MLVIRKVTLQDATQRSQIPRDDVVLAFATNGGASEAFAVSPPLQIPNTQIPNTTMRILHTAPAGFLLAAANKSLSLDKVSH